MVSLKLFQHKVLFSPLNSPYKDYYLMLKWKPLIQPKSLPVTVETRFKFDRTLQELGSRAVDIELAWADAVV
jgi:hypothetical protein